MTNTNIYIVMDGANTVSTHNTPELAVKAAKRRGGYAQAMRMTNGGAVYPIN